MVTSLLRYYNTLRYLKISQIFWRMYYKFKIFNVINSKTCLAERVRPNDWRLSVEKPQKLFGKWKICFLNLCQKFEYEVDWNVSGHSKLWDYNLHYFDDLISINAYQRKDLHQQLIKSWVEKNPVGIGIGWESYPISLRIVNWIKWTFSGNKLNDECLRSAVVQSRYLSKNLEKHILGNHYFSNAKALVFSGLFFQGEEAEKWLSVGLEILNEQLSEQVLHDGGHFELSPMYHAIVLEDMLDMVNLFHCYNQTIPHEYKQVISRMLAWLSAMSHPDGEIGLFNDATFGIAANYQMLSDYASRLGCDSTLHNGALVYLPESGYVRTEYKDLVVLSDIAQIGLTYQPGHAHADTLSFECSLFGRRLIVNSGTSVYGTSKERLKQRGTASHSTVVIDNKNSSEVWGGFRVARRAKVYRKCVTYKKKHSLISACHTGYKNFQRSLYHCRKWIIQPNKLIVEDVVEGHRQEMVVANYYIAPEVEVRKIGDRLVQLNVEGKKAIMEFSGSGALEVSPSMYHPEFGFSVDNYKIVWNWKMGSSGVHSMILKW